MGPQDMRDPPPPPQKRFFFLTSYFQGSIAALDADPGGGVGRHAVVGAHIRFVVLVVDDPQEEQLSARQQHPVGRRVLIGCDDGLAVPVPRDDGRGVALSLTVEGGRFVLGHVLILWVFNDAWVGRLLDTCKTPTGGATLAGGHWIISSC